MQGLAQGWNCPGGTAASGVRLGSPTPIPILPGAGPRVRAPPGRGSRVWPPPCHASFPGRSCSLQDAWWSGGFPSEGAELKTRGPAWARRRAPARGRGFPSLTARRGGAGLPRSHPGASPRGRQGRSASSICLTAFLSPHSRANIAALKAVCRGNNHQTSVLEL